jgi:putative phage-type endonuclease
MPPPTGKGHGLRSTRVGASEVGALMGSHPYQTPADVWARLVGAERPRAESAAMAAGNALESTVAQMWAAKERRKVHRCAMTYAHPEVALCATPDYYVPHHSLLEIKVSGDYDLWRELPEYVYWQVMAQLACTGRIIGHVAVLLGSSLRTYRVDFDGIAAGRMLDAVAAFDRDYVQTRTPPPDAGGELVLRVLAPEAGTVAADERDESLAYRMALAREQMSRGEEAYKRCREELAAKLAGHGARLLQGRGWTFGPDARGAIQFRGDPRGSMGADK